MENKKEDKKIFLGLSAWLLLSFIMLRDPSEKIQLGGAEFFMHLLFGAIFSYYIVAYFFGWPMPLNVGSLKKGKNDTLRVVLLITFSCFWLWGFIGF